MNFEKKQYVYLFPETMYVPITGKNKWSINTEKGKPTEFVVCLDNKFKTFYVFTVFGRSITENGIKKLNENRYINCTKESLERFCQEVFDDANIMLVEKLPVGCVEIEEYIKENTEGE